MVLVNFATFHTIPSRREVLFSGIGGAKPNSSERFQESCFTGAMGLTLASLPFYCGCSSGSLKLPRSQSLQALPVLSPMTQVLGDSNPLQHHPLVRGFATGRVARQLPLGWAPGSRRLPQVLGAMLAQAGSIRVGRAGEERRVAHPSASRGDPPGVAPASDITKRVYII